MGRWIMCGGKMFRRGKHSEGAVEGKAVVIAATAVRGAVGVGFTEIDALQHPVHYELKLRVQFDDGSTGEAACRVGGRVGGTDLSFSEGDVVPVRYNPADRSKVGVDEQAMLAERSSRREAFSQARVLESELRLQAAEAASHEDGTPPSDTALQTAYDSWCTAMDEGTARMEAHQQAKAAGNAAVAAEELRVGALANARQVALGEECKRLRKLRPDWKPAKHS
jgi:hypothetical protein